MSVGDTDPGCSVKSMLGPMGVDSTNSTNESVSSVVCCYKLKTMTDEAEEVTECATVGFECKSCATMESECKITVHYESGYVSAGYTSENLDLAYKTLTTVCG